MGKHIPITLRNMHCKSLLFEGVLAQSVAAEQQAVHIGGNFLAHVLVHVDLGKVLAQHEAVTLQADEQAVARVDDVARLGVVARPEGLEADGTQLRNPLAEHLGADFEEVLCVVFQVLARFGGVGTRRSTTDNLARLLELLSVNGGEAFVTAAVDEHVEAFAILAQHRQTAGDKGLVLNGIKTCFNTELFGELGGLIT